MQLPFYNTKIHKDNGNYSGIILKGWTVFVCLLAVNSAVCAQVSPVSGAADKPAVVVLNSYHPGYTWSDAEQEGILEMLHADFRVGRIAVEYLDSKNHNGKDYLETFRRLLAHKYLASPPQVVIAMDNAALDFALQHRKALFSESAVVFCGINDYSPEIHAGQRNITGVAQNIDPEGTIDIMLGLHPETKEIFVVNDYTLTGLSLRKEIEAIAPNYAGRVKILHNDNVPFADLKKQLASFPSTTLVLLQSYAKDAHATVFDWQDVTVQMTQESRVPVYGVHAERLGLGIVGGKLLDGRQHGREAAALALRIVAGEKADEIPIVTKSNAQAMFDHSALVRFGISPVALPSGAAVINKPVRFLDRHWEVIVTASVIILYLLIVIIFLSIYIFQRKRAARALAQSEERFRSIIENADAGYFFVEINGRIGAVNRAWARLYGYDRPEDVIGRNFVDLQKDDDIEQLKKILRGVLHNDARFLSGLFSRKMKDGTIGYHTYSARAVWLEGKAVGMEGFIIDTTALERTQNALAESERRFRSLFDAMTEGVALHELIYDEHGIARDYRIIDVNPAYEKHTGIPVDQARGRTSGLLYLDQSSPYLDVFSRVAVSGEPAFLETYFQPMNRFFSVSVFSPGPGQFATVFQDITERKHMEAALAAEKERLSVTLRSIGDGVIATDTEGRVTLMNEVAESLTGWTISEARGKPLADVFRIIHEETRQRCEDPVQKVLKSGHIVGLANHTVLIAKDGKEIIIADSAAPIRDTDNRTIGIVLVFRDTTDTKKMEEALRNAQKLEAIGILAGGIAHDFNNLLSGLYGYLELIRTEAAAGDCSKVSAGVEKAFSTYERAKGLTLQLLTFAKGGTPIRKIQSLDRIVRDGVMFMLSGSNIVAEFDIPQGGWFCNCDENQIAQVIDNITINARQAMPDGGRFYVVFKRLSPKEAPPDMQQGPCIAISMRDTGEGIAAQHIANIFDPFFTTRAQGSGLGLATSYSIIKRHGGHISVQSRPGGGSEFFIYLPQAEGEPASVISEKMPAIQQATGNILVMDDEEFILDVAQAMLVAKGFDVTTALNGDEAVDQVREAIVAGRPFIATILDLTIPGGKGGREITAVLRDIDPKLKIVASSGYSEDPVMSNPSAFGFDARLVKPYRLDDLISLLGDLLS